MNINSITITSLIKSGLWLTLAKVVSKLVTSLTLPILGRLLGPESFGIYTVALSLIQLAQNFSDLGVTVAIQRNGAQYQILGKAATGRLFGVGLALISLVSLALGLAVWIWQAFLVQSWLHELQVAPWLGIAAIVIAIQPFGAVPLLFLAGLQEFRSYALRSSLGLIVGNGIAVVATWQFGLAGAIWGLLLAALLQIVWSYLIVKPVLESKGIRVCQGFCVRV